uniref:Uncharacterized protein n=1 Tax=Siphoviridae sp. ctqBH20 TaxID=2825680 RepID=A0A8S5QCG8_9CAUD|nr:MAG TPA: hypothetical protein [Siphoviridae sp. ctqBH20]
MASCPIDWTELRVAPISWLSGADLIRVSSLSDENQCDKFLCVRRIKLSVKLKLIENRKNLC